MLARDERGEVRLVRDVEEDGADPDEEPDHVELPERQRVRDIRNRNAGKEYGSPEVACDQDRAARQPVNPDPGREREEDEGEELDRSERRDLERRGVENEHGGERQRELRDLSTKLADGLRRPQLEEVAVAPESPRRPARSTHLDSA